mmetsp:Transcript_23559/g.49050  ORF Transcript_23559/g.49050 Transcript_23559/m.49050 type:complete len:228 (+) Transcript_23559:164-847(+)
MLDAEDPPRHDAGRPDHDVRVPQEGVLPAEPGHCREDEGLGPGEARDVEVGRHLERHGVAGLEVGVYDAVELPELGEAGGAHPDYEVLVEDALLGLHDHGVALVQVLRVVVVRVRVRVAGGRGGVEVGRPGRTAPVRTRRARRTAHRRAGATGGGGRGIRTPAQALGGGETLGLAELRVHVGAPRYARVGEGGVLGGREVEDVVEEAVGYEAAGVQGLRGSADYDMV